MKFAITVIFLLTNLISCNTQTKKNQDQLKNNAQPSSHTSQNSLDWRGVYIGTMPCADCEGIKTVIELNDDLTYSLTTQYLGKSDSIYRETGKFEWSDDGKTVSLQGVHDRPGFHRYKVVENALVKLDKNRAIIESQFSERYRLKKDASNDVAFP